MVTVHEDNIWDQGNWIDDGVVRKDESVVPLINHLHDDRQSGQFQPHYHSDGRYGNGGMRIYPHELKSNQKLEERYMSKIRETQPSHSITNPNIIHWVKDGHKCKGKKCPHRGYDLSNETPGEDGMVTCPLHGIKSYL